MKKGWALLASVLLFGGMAAGQQEESLGELARRLRAKKAKPAAKVYTNEDVSKPGGRPLSVVGQAGAATASTPMGAGGGAAATSAGGGGTEKGAARAATEEKGEKYWKGKFAEARNKVAQAEKELNLLEREWQLERSQGSQDPNEAMRQQYLGQQPGGKLADLQQKIQQKKVEVENLKRELANLENDLRREGGNPGWARP